MQTKEPNKKMTPSKPTPIDVAILRFAVAIDGAGLAVASGVSAFRDGRPTRHRIQFLPWLRHFRIEYDRGDGQPALVSMIHEGNVKSWDPVPAPPSEE